MLALLVCVKLFSCNGMLMGQAAADVVNAFIALGLLMWYDPMAQKGSES